MVQSLYKNEIKLLMKQNERKIKSQQSLCNIGDQKVATEDNRENFIRTKDKIPTTSKIDVYHDTRVRRIVGISTNLFRFQDFQTHRVNPCLNCINLVSCSISVWVLFKLSRYYCFQKLKRKYMILI